MYDQIKQKMANVKIVGKNLGVVDNCSFGLISEHFDLSDEGKVSLNFWENFYFNLFNLLQLPENKVNFLDIEEDHVNIYPGQPFHSMVADPQALRNISICGLVASEWFGQLESEGEAYCCTFLNTFPEKIEKKTLGSSPTREDLDYYFMYSEAQKNYNIALGNTRNLTLFFDMNNPIMKMLMNYDFFEYLKIRKQDYNKLQEIYPQELIDFYENVCSAQSLEFSSRFHDDNAYRTKSWLAIPLGIPPMLINGICINSKIMSNFENCLEELSTLFPNATIFNEKMEIITYPLNMSDDIVRK